MEIIRRQHGNTAKEAISRIKTDAPQIAYNSKGRITVRIPQIEGDVLVVFDRPLSRELIRFVKNGVAEMPNTATWCATCANEFNNDIPF
jgi:hypothetical protein